MGIAGQCSARSRRALLRGQLRADPVLRPPWALDETDFVEACSSCGACVAACPQRVLVAGDGRLPEFDPSRGECTFCGECAAACEEAAFRPSTDVPWSLRAAFGDDCLARLGVVCSSCRDACGEVAIAFPVTARIPVPVLAADRCSGCGACVAACPTRAISLHASKAEALLDG